MAEQFGYELDARSSASIRHLPCDRIDRVGGGVCALIPKSFRSSELSLSEIQRDLMSKSGCEVVYIGCLYRPPFSAQTQIKIRSNTSNLCNLLIELTHAHHTSVLAGDFNLPKICWTDIDYPSDGVMTSCIIVFPSNAPLIQYLTPNLFKNSPVTGSLEISFFESNPSSLIATNVSVSTLHNLQTYLSSVEFPRVVSWVQSSSIYLLMISLITSQMMSEPNSLLTISNCIQTWT